MLRPAPLGGAAPQESGRYTFCLAVWEKGVRTKEGQAGPGKAEAAPRWVGGSGRRAKYETTR